jgi:DNA polymerase-3 subunit delta'
MDKSARSRISLPTAYTILLVRLGRFMGEKRLARGRLPIVAFRIRIFGTRTIGDGMSEQPGCPSPQDAREAFLPALAHGKARRALRGLRADPPRSLLLEGGTDGDRLALALWYAALLNCPQAGEKDEPCLECPACLQTGAGMFVDLHVLDGRDSGIKADTIRALRPLLGEAPRAGGTRVVLLAEAQALSVQAANALLKSLEEPRPGTIFILLAPQRERLLPTLVSRSWVLTLPWPDPAEPPPQDLLPWSESLAAFLQSGKGWFALTAGKGAVDANSARQVVLLCQKALAGAIAGREAGGLGRALAQDRPLRYLQLRDILADAQEALEAAISPALALDCMAARMFTLLHQTESSGSARQMG